MTVAISTLGWVALELAIHDKLDSSDYERFTALAKDRIRNHGEVNLLVRATNFRDWSPAALWQDLRFDVAHYDDVSRLALVAEQSSREWMASLSKPFSGARVEFFPDSELESARQWVRSGLALPPDDLPVQPRP
jgi:hypothetical protein